MTIIRELNFALSTIGLILIIGLTSNEIAFANQKIPERPDKAHDDVIAQEPALVNRVLQGLVSSIGDRVLNKSEGLGDMTVLLLDSGRVDSFHSSSGYIYLTRGLLLLARNESHIASIVAIEAASLEKQWKSATEHYKRAADILSIAGYEPTALLDFISTLVRHRLYAQTNLSAQSAIGQGHHSLAIRKYNFKNLASHVSKLSRQRKIASQPDVDPDFLARLNGLRVGQSVRHDLRVRASQIAKGKEFTLFLPSYWKALHGEEVEKLIPLKSKALGIQKNNTTMVLRSPQKKAVEVIVFATNKPDDFRSAQQSLNLQIQKISSAFEVDEEGPITGINSQGYVMDGYISIPVGGYATKGISISGSVTSSFPHLMAIIPFEDKLVIVTTFLSPFSNDYNELDKDAFLFIVSSISEPASRDKPSQVAERVVKIHTVTAGESVATLANVNQLEDAQGVLRILNGMDPDDVLISGQVIKIVSLGGHE